MISLAMSSREVDAALASGEPEQIKRVEDYMWRLADSIARIPMDSFDEAQIRFYDGEVKRLRKRIAEARTAKERV